MKSRKPFGAPVPVVVAATPPASDPNDLSYLVIALPENPTGARSLDLIPWLGKGIDPWVWACAGQLRSFLASQEVQPSTVRTYWKEGMRYFFEYLEVHGAKFEPKALKPHHIQHFVGWLKERDWAYGTQKGHYQHTKAVLRGMIRRGLIPAQENLFPANPWPGSNRRMSGAKPLSQGERLRLATALREDIIAIHKGTFVGLDSDALVVYLLSVAIRSGANTTPLLEATRDSLREHPFMPNMMRLELVKRRGNATKFTNLRYSKDDDHAVSVAMDGVALLKIALQMTAPLVNEAKPAHKDRVWLYRSEGSSNAGSVTALNGVALTKRIESLIKRHDLRGDDGKPLSLNLSRLRKTMVNRLWALSGGDLIATAALMGHDPKVADTHYLACTQQMRENATFVGEALPDIYDQGLSETTRGKVISILPGKSPTGRCKDPYNGDKAPKNGEACDDFFSCFTCKSYAVVGSPEDLHRLFSFYFFLEREMLHARSEDWRCEFRNTMNLIDRFTADQFNAELVAAARDRGRTEPIKFWASYTLASAEVVHG